MPVLPSRRLLPFVAAALLAPLGGCGEAGKAAAPPPAPPQVKVATPLVQKLIEWDEFTGRFEAVERVEVRPRVTGYLQAIHFKDGQLVKEGDLLFTIDKRPFEAEANRARSLLARAKARQNLARAEVGRAQSLLTRGNIAESSYDQRIAEQDLAAADIAAADAAIRIADLDVEFAEVKAPISGRVSDARVDIGNLVSGGSDPTLLTTIVALDPIQFLFDMSEADFLGYERAIARGDLKPTRDGVEISVRLPDEADWPHEGTIDFVDNAIDPGTGTIRVRALLPNPKGLLVPGQFARLRLPGSSLYDAVLVPEAAIVSDQSRKVLLTVDKDDVVRPKLVRVGPHELGLRIIRSGIEPTDRIVVEGVLRARADQKVTPVAATVAPWPDGRPGE